MYYDNEEDGHHYPIHKDKSRKGGFDEDNEYMKGIMMMMKLFPLRIMKI